MILSLTSFLWQRPLCPKVPLQIHTVQPYFTSVSGSKLLFRLSFNFFEYCKEKDKTAAERQSQSARQSAEQTGESPLLSVTTPPCDQRTKWNKDLDVLHVVFCFTLFRDCSSSFQQTSDISVMQPWRIWDWLGGPRSWWLPRDHVSNDLHYNTIKWLVSSSKVRKHFLLFLTCFPASHPPPSRLSRPFAPH